MRLVLFTRYPKPAKAKTRLIPSMGEKGAAEIHRLLTEKTIQTLRKAAVGNQNTVVEIRYTGGKTDQFSRWLGDDVEYVSQCGGDLTARLLDALDPAPAIFFGSDTPDLSPSIVKEAVDALESHDTVIGPAEDGGYYLIGMKERHDIFTNVPWSTEKVFDETISKLDTAALSRHILPVLSDCDRPEDLLRWPELMQAAKQERASI